MEECVWRKMFANFPNELEWLDQFVACFMKKDGLLFNSIYAYLGSLELSVDQMSELEK